MQEQKVMTGESAQIINVLSDFFMQCPLMKDGSFNIDYLGESPIQYALEVLPCNPLVKKYVDGSGVYRYQFAFTSREYCNQERMQAIDNSAFYEDFYNWVESLNYKDESGKSRLPDLSQCKGLTAKSIHCLTNGYAFEGTMTNARYQIQVELQYIKEVNDGKGSNTETRNR